VLCAGTGCEAIVKKFTRKPKHASARPSPVISFQDYSAGATPQERYRKHYLLFEYWNAELMDELQRAMMNAKRARRASGEAVQELRELRGLLQEPQRAMIDPVIDQRQRLDGQLKADVLTAAQRESAGRLLERQTRQLHRGLSPRKVEDKLAQPPPTDAGGH
jgi:hypothetical protein